MAKGQSVVSGHELHKVLVDLGYAVRKLHGSAVVTIGDVEIGLPFGGRRDETSDRTLSQLAAAIGSDLGEPLSRKDIVEIFLGRRQVNGRKPSQGATTAAQPATTGITKAETLSRVRALAEHVARIERWLKAGTHDSALYRRVLEAVHASEQRLGGLPPHEVEGVESPDDSAYRPASVDSVTTGTARAVGLTAASVRRRKAFTQWEWAAAEPADDADEAQS